MEILILIVFLVVVITYVYVGYRVYQKWPKVAIWELFLVAIIPFWGGIVYLILENNRSKESREKKI